MVTFFPPPRRGIHIIYIIRKKSLLACPAPPPLRGRAGERPGGLGRGHDVRQHIPLPDAVSHREVRLHARLEAGELEPPGGGGGEGRDAQVLLEVDALAVEAFEGGFLGRPMQQHRPRVVALVGEGVLRGVQYARRHAAYAGAVLLDVNAHRPPAQ